MILKQYEISKINLKEFPVLLFYGQNSGAKEEEMLNLINRDKDIKPDIYEEKQVLENYETFHNHIISDSLFEEKKIIIIVFGCHIHECVRGGHPREAGWVTSKYYNNYLSIYYGIRNCAL